MDSFISKITLYDIISTTLPGLIVVLSAISIVPNEFIDLYKNIDNAWFIFGLFCVVSYCTGWILSQLTKYIFKLFFWKNYEKNYIYCIIILITLTWLSYNFINIDKFIKCASLYILFIHIILFINYYSSKKNKKDNEPSEKQFLIRNCYKYLVELYDDFDDFFGLKNHNDVEIEKVIKNMSTSCYMLIQTDPKYNRLHNYNSSKSFSKNLSGACFFLTIILSYHFILNCDIRNECMYMILIFITFISFIVLYFRYKLFENKTNILIATYFIDLMKSKKDRRESKNENSK